MSEPKAQPPLLDENGDFVAALARALEEIFSRYDLDLDDALNQKELQAFAEFCNGKPFTKGELDEIFEYFDTTDDGTALTLSGFYQMYHLQTTSGDEHETWKDLHKHGYDDQFTLQSPKDETTTTPSPDSEQK
ncbi:hypothetical protein IWQ61_003454 [Dispira simplex]|nr:hypothetical protein IWQ61_003454 [Dispira simplex]